MGNGYGMSKNRKSPSSRCRSFLPVLAMRGAGSTASIARSSYSSWRGRTGPLLLWSYQLPPVLAISNTMNRPPFETYWICNGETYHNIDDVVELVAQGHVAREVTAMEQAEAWELRRAQERWHAEALKRHAEYVQDQKFRESPEGKAAAARREALAHGVGIVTVIQPHDAALSELDQYGPAATNKLR